ncbi:MAG: NADH-quinone oxidoreductase subunit C [Pseudomonadota bacterium]
MARPKLQTLQQTAVSLLGSALRNSHIDLNELTLEIQTDRIVEICTILRDHNETRFDQLIDLCGMDYSSYGAEGGESWTGSRYAVVYHLMSLDHNVRIRLRAPVDDASMSLDSVRDVWAGADWFEREAFDLYGIIFNGHPDLRRLLTDYGFIGHPFRKDFPLSGDVEMHYDEAQKRVVYKPVTVEPRVLVPRTIRKDVFRSSADEKTEESAS